MYDKLRLPRCAVEPAVNREKVKCFSGGVEEGGRPKIKLNQLLGWDGFVLFSSFFFAFEAHRKSSIITHEMAWF